LLVVALSAPTRADDVPEASLSTSSATRAETPTPRPAPSPGTADVGVVRPWYDFVLESEDHAHELRFLGIVQGDARLYLTPQDHADTDTFLVRRARLYLEGHVFDHFEYRLMTDFGQGRVQLRDAFVNLHFVDWLQLRVGKFKQPFSYEQFTMEDLTLVVFERSMLDQLTPARQVGAMIFGRNILSGTFEYSLALANGGQRDEDVATLGQGFDGVGMIAVRPFAVLGGIARNLLLAGYASVGDQHGPADPMSFTTPLRTPFFTFASGTRFEGLRWRATGALVFCAGPWGFAAQYAHMEERLRGVVAGAGPPMPAASPTTLSVDAYYALTTLVITGESRDTYAQFVDPRDPLDPFTGHVGPGAFELILRTSGLRVSGDASSVLASSTATTTGAYEVSVGLNWYASRRMWIQLDYEHAFWLAPIVLGQGAPRTAGVDNAGVRATIQW
jgi:phosphate-selective porin OprO/OprP